MSDFVNRIAAALFTGRERMGMYVGLDLPQLLTVRMGCKAEAESIAAQLAAQGLFSDREIDL